MNKIINSFTIILCLSVIIFSGCKSDDKNEIPPKDDFIPDTTGIEKIIAVAVLNPTQGNKVTGSVIFTKRRV